MNKVKQLCIYISLVLLAAAAGLSGCNGAGQDGSSSTGGQDLQSFDSSDRETGLPEAAIVTECTSVPAFQGSTEARNNLPQKYDARSEGRTSLVRDQGSLGTCWAFASLVALESSLLPDEVWDFSEDHMTNCARFRLGQEEGGEFTMAMAYLLSWQGPVTEADDPYGDGHSPEDLEAVRHVQEIQILPSKDLTVIKEAVLRGGGVQTSLYMALEDKQSSRQAYYCKAELEPNHDVVIIGWDDNFPADQFPGNVPGNGAFLCQNSWGEGFGEDGFFYVSYWDANIGKSNVLYSLIEDADNYDSIYQSDLCGWVGQLGYGSSTAWAVNVYQASDQEQLEAVGFYAINQHSEYEVYVVRQVPSEPGDEDFADRRLVAWGTLTNAGFYTIPLAEPEDLEPGERFGVMIKLITPQEIHPIAIEYDAGDGKRSVDLSDGEGYISADGGQWQHVETDQKCNLCLKAYTNNR